jgi:hypothetical protein
MTVIQQTAPAPTPMAHMFAPANQAIPVMENCAIIWMNAPSTHITAMFMLTVQTQLVRLSAAAMQDSLETEHTVKILMSAIQLTSVTRMLVAQTAWEAFHVSANQAILGMARIV